MNILITGAWQDARNHIQKIETMGHTSRSPAALQKAPDSRGKPAAKANSAQSDKNSLEKVHKNSNYPLKKCIIA